MRLIAHLSTDINKTRTCFTCCPIEALFTSKWKYQHKSVHFPQWFCQNTSPRALVVHGYSLISRSTSSHIVRNTTVDTNSASRVDLNGNIKPRDNFGRHPVGQIIYDPAGYMSASISSTDPEHIPPTRNPDEATDADRALMSKHSLAYSGQLHVEWENSTATVGRLTHGPLVMSSHTSWLGTNQSRNYVLTKNASETLGKDILHLWLKGSDGTANLYWMRAEAN
jgi:hypothetical protein